MDQKNPLAFKNGDDLYTQKILSLAASCPKSWSLTDPEICEQAYSRLCGSWVKIEIHHRAHTLETLEVAFSYEGDVLCKAAVSAVWHYLQKHPLSPCSKNHLIKLCHSVTQMVKTGSPLDDAFQEAFEMFSLVRAFKSRQSSFLLVFKALERGLEQL